jgi:hypothetical protein
MSYSNVHYKITDLNHCNNTYYEIADALNNFPLCQFCRYNINENLEIIPTLNYNNIYFDYDNLTFTFKRNPIQPTTTTTTTVPTTTTTTTVPTTTTTTTIPTTTTTTTTIPPTTTTTTTSAPSIVFHTEPAYINVLVGSSSSQQFTVFSPLPWTCSTTFSNITNITPTSGTIGSTVVTCSINVATNQQWIVIDNGNGSPIHFTFVGQ